MAAFSIGCVLSFFMKILYGLYSISSVFLCLLLERLLLVDLLTLDLWILIFVMKFYGPFFFFWRLSGRSLLPLLDLFRSKTDGVFSPSICATLLLITLASDFSSLWMLLFDLNDALLIYPASSLKLPLLAALALKVDESFDATVCFARPFSMLDTALRLLCC